MKATREVLGAFDFKAEDMKVLYHSKNLLLHVQPLTLVAKVASGVDQPGVDKNLELKVADHLHRAGVPCVVPSSIVPVEVHSRDGFQITFWDYFDEEKGRRAKHQDIPGLIRSLHEGLASFRYEGLPRFDAKLDVYLNGLAEGSDEMPGLPESDRQFLFSILAELKNNLSHDPAVVLGIIHGDCRPDNLLRNHAGAVKWIDFEDTCFGPIAWDYGSFLDPGDDMLKAHARTVEILSDIAHVCTAIRCWRKKERKPPLQQAAENYLRHLKQKFVSV